MIIIKDMKNIFYKIIPVCLLAVCLVGCEEDTMYKPLPKAVPLTMSINDNAFVMGERLVVDLVINPDAEGNSVVANEEFDVYFTAKTGTEDMSELFKDFHGVVTFPKGERAIHIDFPITETGLEGGHSLNFVAFARGYTIGNSSQTLKISDYYRVTMALENNPENVVTEGDKFVLVASMDKPKAVPVIVEITAKEGDGDSFIDLPSTMTIPAGSITAKSSAVTLKPDGVKTGDKTLTLNMVSQSAANPMKNDQVVIKMTDLESLADPDMFDMTKVYAAPNTPFVSAKNKVLFDAWWSKESQDIAENSSHSNADLGARGWKFHYATEFHQIAPGFTLDAASGHKVPMGFSDATDVGTEGTFVAVDNKGCSNINENGELVVWAGVNQASNKPYKIAAFHTIKVGGNLFALNYLRGYPGLRIEAKVRLRGPRTGFVPTIELKDHRILSSGRAKTISLLRNERGNMITQSVTGDLVAQTVAKTSSMYQANEWNIYWAEWIDENTVTLGINGVATMTVTNNDLETWPFRKSAMDVNAQGSKGLFMVVRMAPAAEMINNTLPAGWDTELKLISPSNYETEGPRMEIDWIRYYTNDNYKMESNEKNLRNIMLY